MALRKFQKVSAKTVSIFKLKNRRGFAALWRNHLTEGRSSTQAFERMAKAVKRSGFELAGSIPKPK